MNRRAFLLTPVNPVSLNAENTDNKNILSLEPYTDKWNYAEAAYLLQRTTFGVTPKQIDAAVQAGLEKTIALLFAKPKAIAPPLNHECNSDPFVPIGKTWINAPYLKDDIKIIEYRYSSIRCWIIDVLHNESVSITEQLTLFWHNHFGVSHTAEQKASYIFYNLLRENCFGNFKALMKQVSVDTAMLEFLNGSDNKKGSPNENFAREMLELFTVGKGALANKGDYSTFTEEDVREIAKIFTGWEIKGFYTLNPQDNGKNVLESYFAENMHDASVKRLSHHFNKATIANKGADEYAHLIDIIFQSENVALHICRKLYRWFVHHEISASVEQNIIAPLAKQLLNDNYEIKPILVKLLSSKHFFSTMLHDPKIKNPLEFSVGMLKQFQVKLPADVTKRYQFNRKVFESCMAMGMEYFGPPSVSGWKAYYQEPLYYNNWINASTLLTRKKLADLITTDSLHQNSFGVKIDPVNFIRSIGNPSNADALIDAVSDKLFTQKPLLNHQKIKLKEILLAEITEAEWTKQYKRYIANDNTQTTQVEKNLYIFFNHVLCMPEYNII
ncbi:MAG: DUF1800 domain-containing protein [Chitinophagales bacterium]